MSGFTGAFNVTLAQAPAFAAAADPEEACIARCLAGDPNAFRLLVTLHQRVAFSVALRMLGSPTDAEDAVQQAFVDAYAALERFAPDGRSSAFKTWLLRIVVNRCKDVLKSKKRTEVPLDDEPTGAGAFGEAPGDPERDAGDRQRRRHLEAALGRIPAKYRECLVLKDVEDLSYEEMRSILRLPVTTLKIRVVRARAMLRDELGGREP